MKNNKKSKKKRKCLKKRHPKSWTRPPRQKKSVKDPRTQRKSWTRFSRHRKSLWKLQIHQKFWCRSNRRRNPSSTLELPSLHQAARKIRIKWERVPGTTRCNQRTKEKGTRWSLRKGIHKARKMEHKFPYGSKILQHGCQGPKAKKKAGIRFCDLAEWKKSGIGHNDDSLGRVRKKAKTIRYRIQGHKAESAEEVHSCKALSGTNQAIPLWRECCGVQEPQCLVPSRRKENVKMCFWKEPVFPFLLYCVLSHGCF